MMEGEDRRARLHEALYRCLKDSVLAGASPAGREREWIHEKTGHLERLGAHAVLPGDPDFPQLLVGIDDEPTHLFVKGRLPAPGDFTVAVVGTRIPTHSGARFAEEGSALLSRAGVTIVSGLARGIDGLAHGAALDAREGLPDESLPPPTVAVLACGLDYCYPPEHVRLMEHIADRGALVTEFPPGLKPLKHHFLRRNRLLSGLSRLIVVVEARRKSGALVTAQYGVDQGRDVAAVPGDVWSPPSAGPNRLIADGAIPLVSTGALLDLCVSLGLESPKGERLEATTLSLDLGDPSGDLSAVMKRLGPRPVSVDAVSRDLSWPVSRVLGALLELEIRDCVRRFPQGYVRSR